MICKRHLRSVLIPQETMELVIKWKVVTSFFRKKKRSICRELATAYVPDVIKEANEELKLSTMFLSSGLELNCFVIDGKSVLLRRES